MKNAVYYNAISKTIQVIILVISTLFNPLHAQVKASSDPNQLLNYPMPVINGTTINGQSIDASFFKGNVVVIAFGNLINMNSLKQIEFLNRLQKDFKGHPFKVLGVMPNAKQDVIDFNDPSPDNQGLGHQVRMSLKLPLMEYPVVATCNQRNPDNTLHPACDNLVKDFSISSYPVICLVDSKGTIRYIFSSTSAQPQQESYNLIEQQIDILLKELWEFSSLH